MDKEAPEALIGVLDNWAAFFTLLVVLGVGGELVVHVMQSRANKTLIALQHSDALSQEAEIARMKKESSSFELDIAKANKGSAEAIERAAKAEESLGNARKDAALANERAAEANKIAEGEKLARLKIEQKLAPRSLDKAQQERIEAKLKPFSGMPYELAVTPVPEAISILTTIDEILRSSGWLNKESAKKDFRFVFTLRNGSKVEHVYLSGVVVQVPKTLLDKHRPGAEALVLALQAEGIETKGELLPDNDPSPEALHIIVGSKQ